MRTRAALSELGLGAGKRTRLHRILFQHGRCNGTAPLIFGRNVWPREHDESLRFAARRQDILATYPANGGRG
jgi:hypothetical protein